MSEFEDNIPFVKTTDLVNDVNSNAAPKALDKNINYILNLLNGNKAQLSGVFGNLWDYNENAKRITVNGGKFDSFEKCNKWLALTDLKVTNEQDIIYDSNGQACVYKGRSDLISKRNKWLEKEVWIPETLRDQQLIFSMKASGSEKKTNWDEEGARYESIAIQILSAEEDIQVFKTVGLWENQDYYSNESYDPKMTTVHVPFRVSKNTTSVKIKIFRTVNENYLHINKVFVGGLTLPYDNDIESYDLDKLDINELYDFDNGVTKVISTGVLGHKVADKFENIKGSDVVTFEHLARFLKEWVINSSTYNLVNIQGTYSIEPGATSSIYTINHDWIEEEDIPVVTLVTPTSADNIDIIGVQNVENCHFDVVLTEAPTADGYAINWSVDTKVIAVDAQSACSSGTSGTSGTNTPGSTATPMGNYLNPEAALASLAVPEDNIPEPTSYVSIFDYQS